MLKEGGDVNNDTCPGTPCPHAGDFSPSVYGDGWFNVCALITQWAKGVQPQPALEANQTQPGEAA